jgi:hypothetical protein
MRTQVICDPRQSHLTTEAIPKPGIRKLDRSDSAVPPNARLNLDIHLRADRPLKLSPSFR